MNHNGLLRAKLSGRSRVLKWGFLLVQPSLLGLCFTSKDGANGTAGILADLSWQSWAGMTKQVEEEDPRKKLAIAAAKTLSPNQGWLPNGEDSLWVQFFFAFAFPDCKIILIICVRLSCWNCKMSYYHLCICPMLTNSWLCFFLDLYVRIGACDLGLWFGSCGSLLCIDQVGNDFRSS